MEIQQCFCLFVINKLEPLFLTENIAAMKDIWFLGDEMLFEIFHTLPYLRKEARIAKTEIPYLYNQYNVSMFHMTQSQVNNIFTRLCNCLIEAINKHKLPRMIFVMIDKDLLHRIDKLHDQPGISKGIAVSINWISTQFDRIIEAKQEEICKTRIGAILPNEPKIMWIKMIDRPLFSKHQALARRKFNDILEETIYGKKDNFIMGVQSTLTDGDFDNFNCLTGSGRIKI